MEQKNEYAIGDFVRLRSPFYGEMFYGNESHYTTGVIICKELRGPEVRSIYWFKDEYKYLISLREFYGDYAWIDNDTIDGRYTNLPIEYKLSFLGTFGEWWYGSHKSIYQKLLIEALN